MSTLLAMRTSLRSRVGNPSTSDVPDAVLDDCLNRAYVQITDRFKYFATRRKCYFATVADQQRYNLPSALLNILSVSDITNRIELTRRDDTWANNNQWDGTTTAKPTDYFRYMGWIGLSPVPDGVYNIEVYYKYAIAALADDADQPVTPSTWDEGIILLARAIYHDDRQDVPKAQYAQNFYKMWLSDKPDELQEELQMSDWQGVIVPTKQSTVGRRLDFDHYPYE